MVPSNQQTHPWRFAMKQLSEQILNFLLDPFSSSSVKGVGNPHKSQSVKGDYVFQNKVSITSH